VRPDDTLTGTTTVVDAQPSSKDPTRGTVFIESAMTNQDGVVVMTMKSRGMFGRRKA
jgi:acyl dehydratase